MNPQRAHKLPSVYLITDRSIARPDLYTALESALKGGIRLIQLREKDLPSDDLKSLAEKILHLTRFYGAHLLLNGSPELALEIGADGVQLGVQNCKIASARHLLGEQALIGFSAHSSNEIISAAAQGANFATFSPVYYTASKAQYGPPQGLDALRSSCQSSPIPVFALGGINRLRIDEVLAAGAHGVALISALFNASDIQAYARELLRQQPPSHPG